MTMLARLYPRSWRERYGPEMAALLESRPPGWRARLDLARGAIDAWLHPPVRSLMPALAAFIGGALWSLVALQIVLQPVPPDWPGYLVDGLLVAAAAVLGLGVAVVGAWLRAGDSVGGPAIVALDVAAAGHLVWAAALVAALVGLEYGPATAIAQTAAAAGTTLVGLVLVRARDERVGVLLVIAGVGLVVPSAWGWLGAGLAWLAIGAIELRDRHPERSSLGAA